MTIKSDICTGLMPLVFQFTQLIFQNYKEKKNGLSIEVYYTQTCENDDQQLMKAVWINLIKFILQLYYKLKRYPHHFILSKIEFTTQKYNIKESAQNTLESGIKRTGTEFCASNMIVEESQPTSYIEMVHIMQNNEKSIMSKMLQCTIERGWQKYDQPINLTMALTNEFGELVEQFQWKDNDEYDKIDDTTRQETCFELADILVYAMRIGFYMNFRLSDLSI